MTTPPQKKSNEKEEKAKKGKKGKIEIRGEKDFVGIWEKGARSNTAKSEVDQQSQKNNFD